MATWQDAIENKIIESERWAKKRSRITGFESEILAAEIQALKHPYSTYVGKQREYVRDKYGDITKQEVDVILHDEKWIIEYIQKLLGSTGLLLGAHQIHSILTDVSSAFFAAEIQFGQLPLLQLPLPMFGTKAKIFAAA